MISKIMAKFSANISEKSLKELISLERSCLIYATKCLPQTDTDVLNLMTNVLPIDLHLKVVVAKKFIQIQSGVNPLNDMLRKWISRTDSDKHITTFTNMWLATKQILKTSYKNLEINQTKEHDILLPNFQIYGILAESNNSKEEQLSTVMSRIQSNDFDYIIATDGSKLGDGCFGKTGASAVIYRDSTDSAPSILKTSLGTESNSYYAEMKGIELGLKYMRNVEEPSRVLFLSDCIPQH